ncbi:MAG: hypothetical protein GX322_02965, partial [Firmicutes bacterium]|nr:hypothetical protein [Bacillota bacterium]
RNKQESIMPLKRGAAMLASRSDASIVPIAIQRIKRRITIRVGTPLMADWQTGDRKSTYELINQHLQEALMHMLEPVPN